MPLYDPERTALVVIDLQARVLGLTVGPHPARQAVEKSAELAKKLRAQGGLIVHVRVSFAPDFADALKQPVDAPTTRPPGARGDQGIEYAPELEALPPDLWIVKKQWGAFFGTELDLQLRRRGIDTIVLTGIATNMGVEQTAREAWQHGYAVILAEDATTSLTEEMHRFSVEKIMPRIARVRSTAEILANQ